MKNDFLQSGFTVVAAALQGNEDSSGNGQ